MSAFLAFLFSMATSDSLIACVGKPSAGKSSFLNAGNYASIHRNESLYMCIERVHQSPMQRPKWATIHLLQFNRIMVSPTIQHFVHASNSIKQNNVNHDMVGFRLEECSLTVEIGQCVDGMRYVPVRMLDVAGLVPGASEGRVIYSYRCAQISSIDQSSLPLSLGTG